MRKKKPPEEPTLLDLISENKYSQDILTEDSLAKFTKLDFAKALAVILIRQEELQNEIFSLQSGKADKQYRNDY